MLVIFLPTLKTQYMCCSQWTESLGPSEPPPPSCSSPNSPACSFGFSFICTGTRSPSLSLISIYHKMPSYCSPRTHSPFFSSTTGRLTLECPAELGFGLVLLYGCFCLLGSLCCCLSLMWAATGLLGSRSFTKSSLSGIIVPILVFRFPKMLKFPTALPLLRRPH